jgi:eukaryotic-like serine/threonine-protein kinase
VAVKCPKCESENPDTLKFCGECGTQLIPSSREVKQQATETVQTPVQVLTPGATFAGRYEIIEELGHGGMGLVYKARDTRLDRFVAIKVLPRERISDSERKLRFIREARAASALNHANIIHIYDIEKAEDIDFIAMEYVDGRTLNELIGPKGLKLDEALRYAVQIADALTTAHEAGIVHRDLKPGNVMVTGKGQVKVLDFGLAKLTETLPLGQGDPTLTLRQATEEGAIVGTIAYMSPEQAEGMKVDARSDIFSFGALLYEMVTGRQAFQGASNASTLASVLKDNPKPAGELVESLPTEMERLISRCLRKDINQRFQHMADVKITLEEIKEAAESGTLTVARQVQTKRSPYPKLAAIAVIVVGLAAARWLWLGRSHPKPEAPVNAVPLTSYPGWENQPSFSPDGTQVAFARATGESGGISHIYVKQIGVEPPPRLTDSPAEETSPAWSPDGRFIAFRRRLSPTSFGIVVVPQRGGRERLLAEVDTSSITWANVWGPYLDWTPDSKWLSCPCPVPRTGGNGWGLFLFSVESGEKTELTRPPGGVAGDTAPAFSPDGRLLAFSRQGGTSSDLYLLKLTKEYAPQGEPGKIQSNNPWNFGAVWTPNGKEIVFETGTTSSPEIVRMAIGKKGLPRKVEGVPNNASTPAVSRQGGKLAFAVYRYDTNIWRQDLPEPGRKPASPVQLIASTQLDYGPVYSRNGGRIVFLSQRSGTDELWVVDSDGSNPVQVTNLGIKMSLATWSPDGAKIAFQAKTKEDNVSNIYVVNVNGGPWKRLTSGPYLTEFPFWSRDGRWIYFDLCGPVHCDIWRIPSGGGKPVQITRNGGASAFESPDGRFIYYQLGSPPSLTIWRVPVEGGEENKILDSATTTYMWAVGKKKIYFFATPDQEGHSDLMTVDPETGETWKILTVERALYSMNIEVSPDERSILYSQIDEETSDLMLVENFK